MTDIHAQPDPERRKVFGEVAEQYESARPGYPEQLVDDVLEFAGPQGRDALEVGAGTGKATLAFAARGVRLTCVEPDPRMAAVLERKTAGLGGVTVVAGEFESWPRPARRRFGLLLSAQAWHWVDPVLRWELAKAALVPGGAVALFWNDWYLSEDALREEVIEAHLRQLGELPDHSILDARPRESVMGDYDWVWEELRADRGFAGLTHRRYVTEHVRSTAGTVDLLTSLSFYRRLPPDTRAALLAEVASLVDAHGGAVRMTTTTGLFLARTVG
ncbi:class I SAM-dependent methyltransferase [Streptomyces orinoci]|uniref:Class I SAM-dependent methyltransferase n=1 Tax=Streptomyces orinoci TaxID=67339 RepID=A0ABV3JUR3_STRON|nr:class I SAM-dependent methyltransferase [Streptomyces orinoci]